MTAGCEVSIPDISLTPVSNARRTNAVFAPHRGSRPNPSSPATAVMLYWLQRRRDPVARPMPTIEQGRLSQLETGTVEAVKDWPPFVLFAGLDPPRDPERRCRDGDE